MPRTEWEQSDPQLKDDPQWNNEAFNRECAEEAHYEKEFRIFRIPLYISSLENQEPFQHLEFYDFFNKRVTRQLDRLTPNDCRIFCFKDCAIYGNTGITAPDHSELFDHVYREWFPHRASDKDVSDGSFFAKFMRFTPPATSLCDVWNFHLALCARLSVLEGQISLEKPAHPAEARPSVIRPLVEYRLRDTFRIVCILLNQGWRKDGVLLMWRNKEDASHHKCVEKDTVKAYHGTDDADLGGLCVFRCSLEQAMQFVVSTDPERATPRKDYNMHLQEMLGEEDAVQD